MRMVVDSRPDCLDCDGCFDHIAEFAERELKARPLNEALKNVEVHLKQCPCCQAEYQVLLEGLQELKQDNDVD